MDTGPEPSSSRINPDRIRKSSSYRSALAKAAKVLKKPEKILNLVNEAINKIGTLNKGPIIEAKESMFALFRLLKAYAKGEYREVSWSNLVLVISALMYVVMPVDLIPDLITGLGYLDDAAIITWTINAMGQELDKFKIWENGHHRTTYSIVEMAED